MARPSEYTPEQINPDNIKRGISGIYALLEDGVIRYVGQAKCIIKRYKQHCQLSNNCGRTRREQWLNQMLSAGAAPGIAILEQTTELDAAEIEWIGTLRQKFDLTNTADGGKTMRHTKMGKEQMPWRGTQAPVQKALINIRLTVKFLRKTGRLEAAQALQIKADKAQKAVAMVRRIKGNDGWIAMNTEYVRRTQLENNQPLSI